MTRSRVKIAAVGLGNRTCKYLRYMAEHQDVAELVAVVDTDSERFHKIQKFFNLPTERCFTSLDALANSAVEVDACIIGTPDIHHHEMAVKSMRSGWHVLLEKPMGQTIEQCNDIVRVSEETRKLVSVCYVLRYHPYFIKLKELTERPEMGKIRHVRQVEIVGKDRLAHTFVRGPWNRTEMNTSVFFTKCCHDVDFALWLIGDDVVSVKSETGPKMFEEKNAPCEGKRCIECPLESSCPYSAVDLYLRRKDWIKGFVSIGEETEDETIIRTLKESRYGRCVFGCPENDVTEYQKVSFISSSGASAEIVMDCIGDKAARSTTVECENAMISGDESTIKVHYKDGSPSETYDFEWAKSMELHAGADLLIVKEFIDSVRNGILTTRSTSSNSLASHRICLLAEKHDDI